MEKEVLLEIYRSFYDKKSSSERIYGLKCGEYSVGTNGEICIYVKNDLGFVEAKSDAYLNLINRLDDIGKKTLIDVDKLITQLELKVPLIDEESDPVECDYCDGDGYIECNLGHEHECIDCRGKGIIHEGKLTGNKIKKTYFSIELLSQNFQYKYLILILEACKKMGISKIYKTHGLELSPAKFITDEGINFILMPTRTESEVYLIIN